MDAQVPSLGGSHEPDLPPSPDSQSTASGGADDGVQVPAWCCRESQGLVVHHCPVCTGCMCDWDDQQRKDHRDHCKPTFEYTTKVGDVTRSFVFERQTVPFSSKRSRAGGIAATAATILLFVCEWCENEKKTTSPFATGSTLGRHLDRCKCAKKDGYLRPDKPPFELERTTATTASERAQQPAPTRARPRGGSADGMEEDDQDRGGARGDGDGDGTRTDDEVCAAPYLCVWVFVFGVRPVCNPKLWVIYVVCWFVPPPP